MYPLSADVRGDSDRWDRWPGPTTGLQTTGAGHRGALPSQGVLGGIPDTGGPPEGTVGALQRPPEHLPLGKHGVSLTLCPPGSGHGDSERSSGVRSLTPQRRGGERRHLEAIEAGGLTPGAVLLEEGPRGQRWEGRAKQAGGTGPAGKDVQERWRVTRWAKGL